MSADGRVTVAWGDSPAMTFRLAIAQIAELEEKCGLGIAALHRRVASGDWYARDLVETIRLGLIGGGALPVPALKLVARYVEARPLMESVPVATLILVAALIGVPDDPLAAGETESPPTGSVSPSSTVPAPPSD